MPEYKNSYASLDDVPETVDDFRSLFSERNGRFEMTGIAGAKTVADVARIDESLEKERNEHRLTREKLAVWGGMSHEDTVASLDRITELEAAAGDKLDAAGIDLLVEKRVAGTIDSRLAPLNRDIAKLTAANADLLAANTGLNAGALKRAREDYLRPIMLAAKIVPEHTEDVLMYAEKHLALQEGTLDFFAREGLSGVTSGSTAADWLQEMAAKRPGWLPPSQGGGARGSGSGGGFGGANPWARETWNATAQAALYRDKGAEFAERMAKAAGTTLTGGKPLAKP